MWHHKQIADPNAAQFPIELTLAIQSAKIIPRNSPVEDHHRETKDMASRALLTALEDLSSADDLVSTLLQSSVCRSLANLPCSEGLADHKNTPLTYQARISRHHPTSAVSAKSSKRHQVTYQSTNEQLSPSPYSGGYQGEGTKPKTPASKRRSSSRLVKPTASLNAKEKLPPENDPDSKHEEYDIGLESEQEAVIDSTTRITGKSSQDPSQQLKGSSEMETEVRDPCNHIAFKSRQCLEFVRGGEGVITNVPQTSFERYKTRIIHPFSRKYSQQEAS